MKLSNLKKTVLAISLGMGLSFAVSGSTNAVFDPDPEQCARFLQTCEAGGVRA